LRDDKRRGRAPGIGSFVQNGIRVKEQRCLSLWSRPGTTGHFRGRGSPPEQDFLVLKRADS
jgi:hypothetical protein